ncbi:MAG: hypothetical protein SNG38_08255 [Rikenellaceae bacterium]
MKMIIKQFVTLLVLLFVLCGGCGTYRHAGGDLSSHDSVRVEIRERIVTLEDTAIFELPHSFQSVISEVDSSYLENKYSKSVALIDSIGKLHHSLETKPQTIYAPIVSHHRVSDTMIFLINRVTNTVKIKEELTAWQLFRLNGFWVLLLLVLILIYVVFKL